LNEPDIVTDATTKYRQEQDILSDFIEDYCIAEPLASIPKSELKKAYSTWCEDNGTEPVKQRTFKIRLTEKGIGERRSSDGKTRLWYGIRLVTDSDTDISDKTDKTFENSKLTDKSDVILLKSLPCKGDIKEFSENLVGLVSQAQNTQSLVSKSDLAPEHPTHPCRCGCTDYWLTDWNSWLCCKCHPAPQGGKQ